MRHLESELHKRLAALPSESGPSIRRFVLEAIGDAIPNHFGMYFGCANEADGTVVFTNAVLRGDAELRDEYANYVGTPSRALRCPWMPGEVDLDEVDAFIRTRHFYDDRELFQYEAQRKLCRPLEVGEHLRAVFYDGSRFLGWIGLVRRGIDERFSRAEERTLQGAAGKIKSAIAAAEALENDLVVDGASAVFFADGRLAHATKSFVRWMTSRRRSYLAERIRRADRGREVLEPETFGGAQVRITRMDGPDGVRYLATLDLANPLEEDLSSKLTPRQFEVAEYVAAGSTSREIAKTLDVSTSTVNYHLRNIYERLGIGSRAELARHMAESGG